MSIASKNLYELLGNDPELDPERRTPEVPTKAIDKPVARAGKRNAPAEAPARPAGASSGGRQHDSRNANDNAFRDRGVGSDKNRNRGSGDPGENRGSRSDGARGVGRGRGRGRGGAARGDRHSRTGIAEHDKQAAHGWGGQDGGAEWADEKAGEAIAEQDEKEEGAAAQPDEAEAAEPEPEDKSKSYAAYLAEQAEKKLSLAAENVRKPNEGSSKKFPEGKAIAREDAEDYMSGGGAKAKRERERKQKEFVELDDANLHREAENPRGGFRGGRGGRGRGEFRGGEGRGRGEFRGGEGRGRGGRGRGDFRGGEGRGRGGRGGQSSTPNVSDQSAFPSLGS